jgi:hypothetical protein
MDLQNWTTGPEPSEPEAAQQTACALPQKFRQQARQIKRLRETLYELQCEIDPDPAKINKVMSRLAKVRGRFAGDPRAWAAQSLFC